MPGQIQTLVIPADDSKPLRVATVDPDDIAAMQNLVGGYVTTFPLGGEPRAILLCDEDAEMRDAKPNHRATALAKKAGNSVAGFRGGAILGDVAVVGLAARRGTQKMVAAPAPYLALAAADNLPEADRPTVTIPKIHESAGAYRVFVTRWASRLWPMGPHGLYQAYWAEVGNLVEKYGEQPEAERVSLEEFLATLRGLNEAAAQAADHWRRQGGYEPKHETGD